jgi:hypothetical protein
VRAEVSAVAAHAARVDGQGVQGDIPLSTVEKVIYLREASFFRGMTVDQLRVLADVCEEEFTRADARLFVEGDPGGVLYVVVSGRVGIEQQRRPGSVARLATIEAGSYLGETDFFDDNPRTNSATASRTRGRFGCAATVDCAGPPAPRPVAGRSTCSASAAGSQRPNRRSDPDSSAES